MGKEEVDKIIKVITDNYLSSRDFNGSHIHSLGEQLRSSLDADVIRALIKSGNIEVHFGVWGHPNPFIKAMELGDNKSQLKQLEEILKKHSLDHSVFYPTKKHLKRVVKEASYVGRPYSLELALGEPQLSVRHFQPDALIRYRDDPRYIYHFQGSAGSLYIGDEDNDIHDDDKIILKSFGTGFSTTYEDDNRTSITCFVCDLSKLPSSQQLEWKKKEIDKSNYKIDHAFAMSQIFGSWDFDATMYEAFIAELRVINQMSKAINGIPFFKNGFENYENPPRNFHRLLIPTRKEYQSFVETLDKLMSDNLNPKFFANYIPTEETYQKQDGTEKTQPIPSITLLETFLTTQMKFKDQEPIIELVKTFRNVRSIRSKSAHHHLPDEYNYKFNKEQRDTMVEAYEAIRLIRLALANHPQAKAVNVPDWLYEGKIFPC